MKVSKRGATTPSHWGDLGASLEQLEEEKLLRFEKIDLLTSVLDEEFSDA